MNQTSIDIKDGLGNDQHVVAFNIGQTSQTLLVPASTPLDANGSPLFTQGNPAVISNDDIILRQSFVRPNNNTAYASGQLIANDTVIGNIHPMAFAVARVVGGTARIGRAHLTKSQVLTANAIFRAHFFGLSPTMSTVVDGSTLSIPGGLTTPYLGSYTFDFTGSNARAVFSDAVKVQAVPDVGNDMLVDTPSTSNIIYALLEARAAYAPANNETFALALEIKRN